MTNKWVFDKIINKLNNTFTSISFENRLVITGSFAMYLHGII